MKLTRELSNEKANRVKYVVSQYLLCKICINYDSGGVNGEW